MQRRSLIDPGEYELCCATLCESQSQEKDSISAAAGAALLGTAAVAGGLCVLLAAYLARARRNRRHKSRADARADAELAPANAADVVQNQELQNLLFHPANAADSTNGNAKPSTQTLQHRDASMSAVVRNPLAHRASDGSPMTMFDIMKPRTSNARDLMVNNPLALGQNSALDNGSSIDMFYVDTAISASSMDDAIAAAVTDGHEGLAELEAVTRAVCATADNAKACEHLLVQISSAKVTLTEAGQRAAELSGGDGAQFAAVLATIRRKLVRVEQSATAATRELGMGDRERLLNEIARVRSRLRATGRRDGRGAAAAT